MSAYSILSLGLCEELTQGTPLYLRRKVIGETYSTMPKAWEEMLEREYTLKKKKYTWNTLQDRAYVKPQKKSQEFLFFFFLPAKIGLFRNSGEKIEIQSILAEHNEIKLQINIGKWKFMNTWKLNNRHLNMQWIREHIKREIRKYLVMNKNENPQTQAK